MTQPLTSRPFLAALAALALSACFAPKIDPNAPDEIAFRAALAHYDAGFAALTAARAATDPGTAAAQTALARSEFANAEAGFHQLQIDFPASIRVEGAAYREGRSRYEIGTITRSRSDFDAAWTLLQAAIAAHPASRQMNGMTYFSGRSMFHIAEIDQVQPGAATATIQGEYDQARAQFVRSVQVDPARPWGDHAAYYQGRCDFEVGHLVVHPLELAATPGTDPTRFRLAESELAAIPTASTAYDAARYFLGRSWFEEPVPATAPAARIANLGSAIAEFTTVMSLPGFSPLAVNAAYWRGRSHYALAFDLATPPAVDQPELALALADMKTVAPTTSVHAASALYVEAKCYLHFDPPGPYCTIARALDAAPASACAAYRTLQASFPASPHVAQATTYLQTNGCDPLLCPP